MKRKKYSPLRRLKCFTGEIEAHKAAETAKTTFEQGQLSEDLPKVEISNDELSEGLPILNALTKAGLASSNGEARRHIKGNAH